MTYEVEMKFPLRDVGREVIAERLADLGTRQSGTVTQHDTYYAHPSRDYRQTDHAFRIRRTGDENRLTYKGPLVDDDTKTREEIEVSFASGAEAADRMTRLVTALGFEPITPVVKQRSVYLWSHDDREFELLIDEIAGLGTFLEIETTADDGNIDEARTAVKSLAQRLGLRESERRSYLQLQLERA